MKYVIPSTFYLFSLLTGGESFDDVIEQQVYMSKYGIGWSDSNDMMTLEREIVVATIVKHEKDRIELEKSKFEAYAHLLGHNTNKL